MNESVHRQLGDLYQELSPDFKQLFVVPTIRPDQKNTDYLYQLYRPFIEQKESLSVQSLSIWGHYRLLLAAFNQPQTTILHYHWLEFQYWYAFFGMLWKLFCLSIFKLSGGHIVWTVHNRLPHDRKYLTGNIWLKRWMARFADRIHVHCEYAANDVVRFLKTERSKVRIIPHPLFPADIKDKDKARRIISDKYNLSLPASSSYKKQLFLMFGGIAIYKQIEEIIPLFENLSDGFRLLIAGQIKHGNQEYGQQIKQLTSRTKQAHLLNRRFNDEEVLLLFSAADYVIINNRTLYDSGVARLALSYQTPLIAPNKGCLKHMEGKSNLQLFDDNNELAGILHQIDEQNRASE